MCRLLGSLTLALSLSALSGCWQRDWSSLEPLPIDTRSCAMLGGVACAAGRPCSAPTQRASDSDECCVAGSCLIIGSRRVLRSPRVSAPPAIDGDLTDWGALEGVRIASAFCAPHALDGVVPTAFRPEDSSARLALRWDARSLYIAALVVDDDVRPPDSCRNFEDDTLELFFDLDVERDGGLEENQWLLRAIAPDPSLGETCPSDRRSQEQAVEGREPRRNWTFGFATSLADGARCPLGSGWCAEIELRWPQPILGEGQWLGFDAAIEDDDGEPCEIDHRFTTWASPTGNVSGNPSLLSGLVRLVEGIGEPMTCVSESVICGTLECGAPGTSGCAARVECEATESECRNSVDDDCDGDVDCEDGECASESLCTSGTCSEAADFCPSTGLCAELCEGSMPAYPTERTACAGLCPESG